MVCYHSASLCFDNSFVIAVGKNIISSTFDSVDILNNIIGTLDNLIIFVDEFHNLSNSNLNNFDNPIFKLLHLHDILKEGII